MGPIGRARLDSGAVVRRRRSLVLLFVTLGVGTVSGCTTFENSDSVATVDGVDISQDDLDAVLGAVIAQADGAAPADGTVSSDAGRFALERLIAAEASRQYIEAAGESISDEERAGVDLEDYATLPEALRSKLNDLAAGEAARGRIAADSAQAAYEASPFESGAVCLRAIAVDAEELLATVQEELAAGTPFADVAVEYSVDATAESGGVIAGANGGACLAAAEIPVDSGGPLIQAVVELGADEYSEPIAQESATGEAGPSLILYGRPFEEVADEVSLLYGGPAFSEYLGTVDVAVDPRYGRWDDATAAVVALT